MSRIEPVRARFMASVGSYNPAIPGRADTVARFDRRFGDHLRPTYIHVVLGGLFLLLAPLQFSERLRMRNRRVHRWTGRFLVVIGLVSAVTGLFFGLFLPIAGAAEQLVVGVFGATAMVALLKGWNAIRRGDIARHRAWMIRAFAVMVGIATVRLVAIPLDFLLTPAGFSVEHIFVLALWTGWGGTLAAGELWLAHTSEVTAERVAVEGAVYRGYAAVTQV
jgi:uncharacterized membrane protein YozB (DUF420 family)